MDGLHLKFQNTEWHSNLAGTFNASNLAAVLSIALELGEEEQEVLEKCQDFIMSVDVLI